MKKYIIAPTLKRMLLSGIKYGILCNFFIFIYILFNSYSFALRNIDSGVVISGVVALTLFTLMRIGKIKGFYRFDYAPIADAVHLFSIAFFNSLFRLMIIVPIDYINHTGEQSLMSFMKLSALWSINPVKIMILLAFLILFYSMFLMKKDVSIASFHGIKNLKTTRVGSNLAKQVTHAPVVKQVATANAPKNNFEMLASKSDDVGVASLNSVGAMIPNVENGDISVRRRGR